ncbi:hypothetical protein R3P38DRAFT_2811653 [Favolaschia claudopus]|uniref:Uncharacterized protein n=1 Tax=Favolaschia claudopus TaxID=2862362 RepID=A0AAV9Z9Q8_9AGAR
MECKKHQVPAPTLPETSINSDCYGCDKLKHLLNIRKSGPRYRKVVFIALNPAGPNLPFHGVTYDPNDNLDHDLPSDYSESESSDDEATSSSEDENSDVTMEDDLQEEGGGNTDTKGKGKQKADGKGKQKAEDSHFDTGFFDEDLAAGVEYDLTADPISRGELLVRIPQSEVSVRVDFIEEENARRFLRDGIFLYGSHCRATPYKARAPSGC